MSYGFNVCTKNKPHTIRYKGFDLAARQRKKIVNSAKTLKNITNTPSNLRTKTAVNQVYASSNRALLLFVQAQELSEHVKTLLTSFIQSNAIEITKKNGKSLSEFSKLLNQASKELLSENDFDTNYGELFCNFVKTDSALQQIKDAVLFNTNTLITNIYNATRNKLDFLSNERNGVLSDHGRTTNAQKLYNILSRSIEKHLLSNHNISQITDRNIIKKLKLLLCPLIRKKHSGDLYFKIMGNQFLNEIKAKLKHDLNSY
jgi:hypothetical protein